MNILISGAGVAGLTTAYWLKRFGFTPTIIEKAPSLPIGGYKIDVRGSALKILHEMGIYDAVVSASTNMQGALLIDKQGHVIQKMDSDTYGHRVKDDVEIVRGTLCQILMDQIPDVEFIFDDVIRGIIPSSNGVQITFKNNSSREFDLVIGADGVHSNVRQLIFGDESHFIHELGLYLCVFTVPNYLHLDRVEMEYAELGRIVAVWSTRNDDHMKACFAFSAKPNSINLRDKTEQQNKLKQVYEDIGWEVPQFLKLMTNAEDFYFDASAQIYMKKWFQDRIVLVGDAGYCASPMSGQGTSLALIGGYILAGELAAAKDKYHKAFYEYEKLMRPFVKVNQALGITAAKLMTSQEKNNLSSWILKSLMNIMPGRLYQFFIHRSTQRIHKAANAIKLKNY